MKLKEIYTHISTLLLNKRLREEKKMLRMKLAILWGVDSLGQRGSAFLKRFNAARIIKI